MAEQKSKMYNIDGLLQNSELVMVSNKYHYLVWFILGLTVISISLHILFSDGNISNSIVLIVCLLTLFFGLSRYN